MPLPAICQHANAAKASDATYDPEELLRLETERGNFTAVRDVAIYRLATDGYSYTRIGATIGLTKDRAAQLVRRANDVHLSATQHASRVKRRAKRLRN